VRLFAPLLLDEVEEVNENVRRACGGLASKLVVPWNERQGHWSLLCLDLVATIAIFYDSLDGSLSEMVNYRSHEGVASARSDPTGPHTQPNLVLTSSDVTPLARHRK